MPKKAFLVDYSIRTRVVVDVPADKTDNSPQRDDELFAIVADAAQEKISRSAGEYLCRENVVKATEDTDCPFGMLLEDIIKNNL